MAGVSKPAIKVEGAKEFRKAMTRMGADLKDLTAIHREMADKVSGQARGGAPRRSGKLAGSVKGRATKTRATVQAGSRLVPYAGPIHFGWPARNIESQPFLYDALDQRRDEVIGLYRKRVDQLVERVARETPP